MDFVKFKAKGINKFNAEGSLLEKHHVNEGSLPPPFFDPLRINLSILLNLRLRETINSMQTPLVVKMQ